MSENTQVETIPTVTGDVIDAPTVQSIDGRITATLSRTMIETLVESGDATALDAWRDDAVRLEHAAGALQSVAVAYMVRVEDMLAVKSGKDKATPEAIMAAYATKMPDADVKLSKSRISQLRNAAIIAIDCGFQAHMLDADASWFLTKAPTGKLPVAAITAAAEVAAKGGDALASLREAREAKAKADAEAKAKADADAAILAKAKAEKDKADAEDKIAEASKSAPGQDTGSKTPTRAAQVPDGHSEDTPLSRAIDAIVKMPQDTATQVADLMRVARELRVILESPRVKALQAEAAKYLAEQDAAEAKAKAAKPAPRKR